MSIFHLLNKKEQEQMLRDIDRKANGCISRKKLLWHFYGVKELPKGTLTPRLRKEDLLP